MLQMLQDVTQVRFRSPSQPPTRNPQCNKCNPMQHFFKFAPPTPPPPGNYQLATGNCTPIPTQKSQLANPHPLWNLAPPSLILSPCPKIDPSTPPPPPIQPPPPPINPAPTAHPPA